MGEAARNSITTSFLDPKLPPSLSMLQSSRQLSTIAWVAWNAQLKQNALIRQERFQASMSQAKLLEASMVTTVWVETPCWTAWSTGESQAKLHASTFSVRTISSGSTQMFQ